MSKGTRPHFEVHPSVVYQLGESLISDAVQALIELVKNCYDADATYAKVIIDTEGVTEENGTMFSAQGGRIIVEDDGHGMDLEDVIGGWLTISNRKKRDLKQQRNTTPGGRTPLGDKGLGRLGVQRLGENLEILTKAKAKKEPGYHFGFSWLDFETAPRLEDVDIHLEEANFHRRHGTKVIVSGLRDNDLWRGQTAVKRLEQELSRMISPYKQIRDFMVAVEVDGKSLQLLEVSDKVRDIAPVRYSLAFDGTALAVCGRVRLDFFRPASPKAADEFALMAESDDGEAFFAFLESQRHARTIHLRSARSKRWFAEFSWRRNLSDLDKVEAARSQDEHIANPGPFTGEVDSFDLGASAFQQQSVFDRVSEYRRHIKELSGIRVYRDGFAIRVDHDWLKLGAQWTSATSYYGLKPDNTLGYITLSARDNMDLEETTDREGFKDSPYYRNFYALLEQFTRFTTTAHEFFGRSWAEFRKTRHEELACLDSRKTVEDISSAIKNGLAEASRHQKDLQAFKARLDASRSASRAVVSTLRKRKTITPALTEQVTQGLSDLEPLLEEAGNVIARLSAYLEEIGALRGMGQVLEDRVESLRRQMDDMYETVALGLTAEALSHEVFNVADQLAKRTKSAQTTLSRQGLTARPILAFIEYVHSSVMALRKQMSFLSPSLRYVREQRHEIDLVAFIGELAAFYKERLAKVRINMKVECRDAQDFVIHMNKGKATQVIDNLILNSEYWLKEDIAQKRQRVGTITIEAARPFLRVYDDGRGVDPSIEHVVFEPFVSAKAKGQGRGLGLFIVKQLLDAEGCSVGLLPVRNRHRRLFKFQIDLRGALHE